MLQPEVRQPSIDPATAGKCGDVRGRAAAIGRIGAVALTVALTAMLPIAANAQAQSKKPTVRPTANPPATSSSEPVAPAPTAAAPADSFINRPIYSEPSTGLQLPPGCAVETGWRSRIGTSDHEVWLALCADVARAWFVRRQVVEVFAGNQARLRFLVVDEHLFAGETAGDSLSLQCSGRSGNGDQQGGYVVYGARWRPGRAKDLQLAQAAGLLRADIATQKFIATPLNAADCARFPEREAMIKQLAPAPR